MVVVVVTSILHRVPKKGATKPFFGTRCILGDATCASSCLKVLSVVS